jgi:transposase-like protein
MEMGTYHVISKEKKEQILNRIKNEGVSVPQAAKDAGISNTTIYTWLGRTAQGQESNTEVLRLKRELSGAYEVLGKLTTELEKFKKKDRHWK